MFAMNTQLDLLFWGGQLSLFETAYQEIFQRIIEIESIISCYNHNSELYNINNTASKKPIKSSIKLLNYINMAKNYHKLTHGYFNISLGRAYHNLKSNGKVETNALATNIDSILIDSTNLTIQYLSPEIQLDFGGIGKGIALDAAAETIDKYNIENAFLSFGGSSILTRGSHPHGTYWPFSLKEKPFEVWKLNNTAMAVSSSYRKIGNESFPHIINPFTGEKAKNSTVVVQIDNAIDAEVLATALVAAPMDDHQKLIANFKHPQYSIVNNMFLK